MYFRAILTLSLVLCFSGLSLAKSEKEQIKSLFDQYYALCLGKDNVEIDSIFSKKFIKNIGGKEKLKKNFKSFPFDKKKFDIQLRASRHIASRYYVELKEDDHSSSHGEFIVEKEEGKFKISGTKGDTP